MRKLEPLRLVHGHQAHAIGSFILRAAGGERRMVEQLARRMEAAGERDQLLQVLEPVLVVSALLSRSIAR